MLSSHINITVALGAVTYYTAQALPTYAPAACTAGDRVAIAAYWTTVCTTSCAGIGCKSCNATWTDPKCASP